MPVTRRQIREAAADSLGLHLAAQVEAVNADGSLSIPKLADYSADPHFVRDAYLAKGDAYRRIVRWDFPNTHRVFLSSPLSGVAAGDQVSIYFLLPPEEWNSAIDTALRQLWRLDRVEVSIVPGQTDYVMPAWLTAREQVVNLEWRTASGAARSYEDVGLVRYIDADGVLTIHLPVLPAAPGAVLVVTAKRYYDPLPTDASTTTCPFPLAVQAAKVEGLRRVWNRHGDLAKQRFGLQMLKAEQELTAMRNEFLPSILPKPYTAEALIDPIRIRWRW